MTNSTNTTAKTIATTVSTPTTEKKNAHNAVLTSIKATMTAAAAIGTSARADVKLKAVTATAANLTMTPAASAAVSVYKAANSRTVSPTLLKEHKANEDEQDAYKFRVSCAYQAAARYAEAVNGGNPEAVKKAKTLVFNEWKDFLSLLSFAPKTEDSAPLKPRAAESDLALLYAAVVRTVREGTEYTAMERENGTSYAKLKTGIAHTGIGSLPTFQKALERHAIERYFNLDGVLSRDIAKLADKSVSDAKSTALTGMEIVKTELPIAS